MRFSLLILSSSSFLSLSLLAASSALSRLIFCSSFSSSAVSSSSLIPKQNMTYVSIHALPSISIYMYIPTLSQYVVYT